MTERCLWCRRLVVWDCAAHIRISRSSATERMDSKRGKLFSLLPPFLQPRPSVVRARCVGCGRCADSCPAHTIAIKEGKAVIDRHECIKCFCCQELCPKHAIEVKKNIIFKLAH